MPSVAVIIPTLNEESFVPAAIASARAAGADEVIVADGGSADRTVAFAQTAVDVVSCRQRGRAVQLNSGAENASSDVLLFLHADCRLGPDAISELRERFAMTPDAVGGCFRQIIDAKGFRYRLLEAGNAWRARVLKWAYGDQGIFVRSDVFRELGGFPQLQLMEDLYFMKRLKRSGRLLLLQSPLLVSARRWQRRGVLRQTARNWAFVTAAHAGASPDWLARFYPNER